MKKLLLLLAICLFQFQSSNACSCSGESAFCDVNSANPTHHIFIGKILRQDSISAEFQVLERIRGVELKDTITIWNFNDTLVPGINCLSAASSSIGSAGDSILIILSNITYLTQYNQHATISDYFAPSNFCSRPYIPILDGLIIGNLTKYHPYTSPLTPFVIDSISINDFKANFNDGIQAVDCDLFVGLESPILKEALLTVYPNPSYEIVFIESAHVIESLRIFNILGVGQSFFSQKKVNRASCQLNVSELPSGIYFIEVRFTGGEKLIKKIIKSSK